MQGESREPAGAGHRSTEVATPASARSPESRQFFARMRQDLKARIFGAEAPSPPEPIRIGRYVVIKRIGVGGMGLIYAAYDDALDRKVAVKLLRPERVGAGSTGQARLLREAQAIARLSHPCVVGVYEVGTHEDQVFIAMEYVDGVTLQAWQHTRSWREVLEAYIAAGKGLAAAHAAGIVHRDFKADNVLVRKDGTVRVLDFGLARTEFEERDVEVEAIAGASMSESSMPLTHTGTVMGTPAYMAPEQHMGGPTDARTDQFSFCVSLHEALYGYRPFAGATLPELRENVLEGRIEPEPRYSEVPPAIRRAVLRGLHADPALRFPDLVSLLHELEPPKAAGSRWRLAAVGTGALALFAAVTMWWGATADAELRSEGERLRARFEQTRIVNAEDELRRLRQRTVSERWDDLVLTYAEDAVAEDPTLAIAALKHLTPSNDGWLAAARTIAADASRRGPVHRERRQFGAVKRLEFTASGDRLLVHGSDERLHVWDLGTDAIATHEPPEGVTIHAFTLDATATVRAAAGDGKLYRLGAEPDAHPIAISSAPLRAIAAAGDRLAVGDDAGEVWVIAPDDSIERRLRRHEGPVRTLAFRPDDPSQLASGGDDLTVWVSFLDRRTHWTLDHTATSARLHWTSNGDVLLSVAPDGDVDAWDDGGRFFQPSGYPPGLRELAVDDAGAVALYHDGTTLAASFDEAVPLELDQRAGAIGSIAASHDGQWIAAAKGDVVQLWRTGPDERGRRALGEVPIDTEDGSIAAVVTLAGGDLLTASRLGRFRRWSAGALDNSTLVADTDLDVGQVVPAPDGRQVAIEDLHGALHVLDLADPRGYTSLGRVRSHRPGPLAWAPDGSAVAKLSCATDPTCLLAIYPADGGVPRPLSDIPGEGRSLRYSADGQWLASEHGSGLWLWNVRTGEGRRIEPSDPDERITELIGYAFVDGGAALRIAAADRPSTPPVRGVVPRASLRVWQTAVDRARVHELFAQAALSQLVSSDGRHAVMMQTPDERALVWFLEDDRFALLPDRLLPAAEAVTGLRVAPGGDAVLLELDGGRRSMVVDLASGQRRTLPALIDPVAWTEDGTVVDVVGGSRVRRWVDPAPEDPAAFLAWLDQITTIVLEPGDLR
jgi:WD40 repeat protein/predicted Ser/Thr protein kinase